MRSITKEKTIARLKRHRRIRGRVQGNEKVPRLCVFRSSSHIYAQIVDDTSGKSICGASTLAKSIAGDLKGLKKVEKSKRVGKLIAQLAQEKGIEQVAFDRGGYLYHGRVRALAEGAREGGLKF